LILTYDKLLSSFAFNFNVRPYTKAIQQLGLAVGIAVANLIGGLFIDSLGWRGIFGVMGIPGYVLAALLFFTLEDPPIDNAPSYGRVGGGGGGGGGGAGGGGSGGGGGGGVGGAFAMLSSATFWKDLWGGIRQGLTSHHTCSLSTAGACCP
jgi:hypothetical protein